MFWFLELIIGLFGGLTRTPKVQRSDLRRCSGSRVVPMEAKMGITQKSCWGSLPRLLLGFRVLGFRVLGFRV